MPPQLVSDERQQAAEQALRRQEADRQRMFDELLASRGIRYPYCDRDNYVSCEPRQQEVVSRHPGLLRLVRRSLQPR